MFDIGLQIVATAHAVAQRIEQTGEAFAQPLGPAAGGVGQAGDLDLAPGRDKPAAVDDQVAILGKETDTDIAVIGQAADDGGDGDRFQRRVLVIADQRRLAQRPGDQPPLGDKGIDALFDQAGAELIEIDPPRRQRRQRQNVDGNQPPGQRRAENAARGQRLWRGMFALTRHGCPCNGNRCRRGFRFRRNRDRRHAASCAGA